MILSKKYTYKYLQLAAKQRNEARVVVIISCLSALSSSLLSLAQPAHSPIVPLVVVVIMSSYQQTNCTLSLPMASHDSLTISHSLARAYYVCVRVLLTFVTKLAPRHKSEENVL